MENDNFLLQFLTSAISGGLIFLLFYLIKRFGGRKIVVSNKIGIFILSICILLIILILI